MAGKVNFDVAAKKFYEILFKRMPDLEKFFGNKTAQHLMFISALRSIDDLKNDDRLLGDYLEMLGRQHRHIGLSDAHWEIGKDAFKQAVRAGGEGLNEGEVQFYMGSFSKIVKAIKLDPEQEMSYSPDMAMYDVRDGV